MARQEFRKGKTQRLKSGHLITTIVVRIGGIKVAIQNLVVTKVESPKKLIVEKKII